MLYISIFVGYKITSHLQVASLLPYIRDCIENGITDEELDKLAAIKGKNFAKFSLMAGLLFGFGCLFLFQFFSGFYYPWLIVIFVSIIAGFFSACFCL